MKRKLRDRLDRIEKAIKQLTKAIENLQVSQDSVPNGDDDKDGTDGELSSTYSRKGKRLPRS